MNTVQRKSLFYPQHKDKCYCRKTFGCCCTEFTNASSESLSKNDFIKTHRNAKNYKFGASSTSISEPTVISGSGSSSSLLQTNIPSSYSLISDATSSEPRLTKRREIYERSKSVSSNGIDHKLVTLPRQGTTPQDSIHYCDGRIAKLQEFRLRNSSDCLSTCSQYRITKQHESKKTHELSEDSVLKYVINARGLVESYSTCSQTKPNPDTSTVPIANPKVAAKDILRQALTTTKDKQRFLRKALCIPDNSLALRYQKTV